MKSGNIKKEHSLNLQKILKVWKSVSCQLNYQQGHSHSTLSTREKSEGAKEFHRGKVSAFFSRPP